MLAVAEDDAVAARAGVGGATAVGIYRDFLQPLIPNNLFPITTGFGEGQFADLAPHLAPAQIAILEMDAAQAP